MTYEKRGNELWWISTGLISFVYDTTTKKHYLFFNISGRWFENPVEKWTQLFKTYEREK